MLALIRSRHSLTARHNASVSANDTVQAQLYYYTVSDNIAINATNGLIAANIPKCDTRDNMDKTRKRSYGYSTVSLLTGLTVRTLRHLVATGQIPHIRYSSRVIRFDEAEIEAWLAPKRREAR